MRVFIFDMDGTFIDSMKYWNTYLEDWLIKKERTPKDDLYSTLITMKLDDGIDFIKSDYNIEDTKEKIQDELQELLAYHYKNVFNIDPSAYDIFMKIKNDGDKLALATSTERYLADIALERFNLKGVFDMEVVGDETELHKDDPEYFYRIMNNFGAKPENCYVFEDSLYAINGANKAGMNTIAVTFQSLEENIDEIIRVTDYNCKNLTELRNRYLNGKETEKEKK